MQTTISSFPSLHTYSNGFKFSLDLLHTLHYFIKYQKNWLELQNPDCSLPRSIWRKRIWWYKQQRNIGGFSFYF
jgi:hypothetical protein